MLLLGWIFLKPVNVVSAVWYNTTIANLWSHKPLNIWVGLLMCETKWKKSSSATGASLLSSIIDRSLISCLSCKLAIFWEKLFPETAPTAISALLTDSGVYEGVCWDHLSFLPLLANGEKLPQLIGLALASDDVSDGLYFSVLSVQGTRAWLPRSAPHALDCRWPHSQGTEIASLNCNSWSCMSQAYMWVKKGGNFSHEFSFVFMASGERY